MTKREKKKTPGVKLSQRTLDRLKKITQNEETTQAAVLTRLINADYDRVKSEIYMKEHPCPRCGDWQYHIEDGIMNVCLTCGHTWEV